ncbi:MAG: hypothetical protein Q9191_008250 [Dirinaria sp. TL-2023a]
MAEALSSFTGVLQGSIGGLLNKGQNILDRFIPPERRNELSNRLSKFATEKPMLASFLLSQVALSSVPLGLFLILTITVFIFALLAAVIIGVLGAVLFSVVCVGIGLIILLPTLFVTTFAAAFIWLWGVGAYYIVKWFNKKEVPGIHKPFPEGMQGEGLDALQGKGAAPGDPHGAQKEKPKQQPNGVNGTPKQPKQAEKKNKYPGIEEVQKATGVDLSDPKKAADFGAVAGKTGDLNKAKEQVMGAKDQVTGAKDQVTGAVGGVKGAAGGVLG